MDFEIFWKSINEDRSHFIKKNFSNMAINLLELLLQKINSDREVVIGYSIADKDSWAIVEYDRWDNNDKSLLLRLNKLGAFEVCFEFWGDDGLEKCIFSLNENQQEMVPQALKRFMNEVVQSGKTRAIKSNELTNIE